MSIQNSNPRVYLDIEIDGDKLGLHPHLKDILPSAPRSDL